MRVIPRRVMIPRWAMPILWGIFLSLFYGMLPYWISLSSRRYGWRNHRPGWLNDLSLLTVLAGVALVVWVLTEHFKTMPSQGARVGNPFEGPGYVLNKGPYALCRHPMHIGTVSIWFGWGLFYGSLAVLIGATILLLIIVTLAPSEERGMEAALGDQYRRYMDEVPRWGLGRRRSKGN